MTKKYLLVLSILFSVVVMNSCGSKGSGGGGSTNPCSGVTIVVSGTTTSTSAPGQSNGAIAATASGASGLQFSINGNPFQASGNYTGLSAGTYTITAKSTEGCTGSATFTVVNGDPCAGKTITLSTATTSSDKCSPTGSITVTATGSTGFTYSLNSGAFQASNVFSNINAASYTIDVKDGGGCVKTTTSTVNLLPAGPLFSAVKSMMAVNCAIAGCHVNPNPTGGLNFQDDCTIVSSWDRIKARAVDGNPSFMPPPPTPQLSAADKAKITNWIAAGHRYTD